MNFEMCDCIHKKPPLVPVLNRKIVVQKSNPRLLFALIHTINTWRS